MISYLWDQFQSRHEAASVPSLPGTNVFVLHDDDFLHEKEPGNNLASSAIKVGSTFFPFQCLDIK